MNADLHGVWVESKTRTHLGNDNPVAGLILDWDERTDLDGQIVAVYRVVQVHRGRVEYHTIDEADARPLSGLPRKDIARDIIKWIGKAIGAGDVDVRHLDALHQLDATQ